MIIVSVKLVKTNATLLFIASEIDSFWKTMKYWAQEKKIHKTNAKQEKTIKELKKLVDLSEALSLLIHETQKERGMSAGYLGSKGKKFGTILNKQRILTDNKTKELKTFVGEIDLNNFSARLNSDINKLVGGPYFSYQYDMSQFTLQCIQNIQSFYLQFVVQKTK